jgi:ABC-type multidrug transport system fused ATPase/permease subunit
MDKVNHFISSVKKDLNIISYKIDNTILDGYFSIIYLLTIVFILVICLYNQPFWSYILLLLFIFLFLIIFTNKEFTKVNIMKIILNITLKPICILFIIIDNIFKYLGENFHFEFHHILLMILSVIILSVIYFVLYMFFSNKIKCKYNLNKIKDNNSDNFNNDNLSTTGENECTKLDLDACYTLEDLQPCLKQLNGLNDPKCNYCVDYSYTGTEEQCIQKTEEEDCTANKDCKWGAIDGGDEKCSLKQFKSSKRLCSDDVEDIDYKIIDNTITCKSKDYCANELNSSYCRQMPDIDSYKWVYVIIYILSLIIILYYYSLKCISDKSFVLIILIINILCLFLAIFLQNTGYSNNNVEYS